jgi:uncharacterized protein (TIGR02996 family)
MSDEELTFRKAICTTPGDDLPRLVYADWLERNGYDPRAEFIRVQMELNAAIWPCDCGSDTRRKCQCSATVAFRKRERELLDTHGQEWVPLKPLSHYVHAGTADDTREGAFWSRGFVSFLTLPWAVWAGGEDTPGVAESLYWRLQPCPECKGGRGVGWFSGIDYGPCPRCSGSGRVVPTVECPNCRGEDCSGRHSHEGRAGQTLHGVLHEADPRKAHHHHDQKCRHNCEECDRTGRVPRPFPETAQPLERVMFTTQPVLDGVSIGIGSSESVMLAALAKRWPGIEFVLPT